MFFERCKLSVLVVYPAVSCQDFLKSDFRLEWPLYILRKLRVQKQFLQQLCIAQYHWNCSKKHFVFQKRSGNCFRVSSLNLGFVQKGNSQTKWLLVTSCTAMFFVQLNGWLEQKRGYLLSIVQEIMFFKKIEKLSEKADQQKPPGIWEYKNHDQKNYGGEEK